MDLDRKKIGDLISTLRRQRGMTQKELADQLHVSDRAVSKWERGAGLPDPSLMIQLSDLLGITVNELLTGERREDRDRPPQNREEVQDAVSLFYQHVRRRARLLRGRIIAGVCAAALLAGGIALALKKAGEDRILFPPEIGCEVLQQEERVELCLEVDRSLSGVYDYTCGYELDEYGNVALRDRSLWQSYTDAVSKEVYQSLKGLDPGTLTSINRTDSGYLACYYRDSGSWALIETDQAAAPAFRYELESGELRTAFLSQGRLYALSRPGEAPVMELTEVDRETGESRAWSFDYQDLSGDSGGDESLGGFLFDGRQMWVQDGVLCFAQTYYGGGTSAVLAAYDLEAGRPLRFQVLEGAQVVLVRCEPEAGRARVLVNPMDYAPLKLLTLDSGTMEVRGEAELELPSEYLTRRDSLYGAETYYLFQGDMDGEQVAILFGDAVDRERMERGQASSILAVYDGDSGRMVWRGRLRYPQGYEISGISLPSGDEGQTGSAET